MSTKSFYRFGALILLLMLGCAKSELPDCKVGCEEEYGSIMVNLNALPLFADVSEYDWNPQTKSSDEDNFATLESLLDRDNSEVGEVGLYHFTCIPLKDEENDKWIYISEGEIEALPAESLTKSKVYVIIAENLETGETEDYVTTLIPDREYTDYFDLKDLRYLERGNFSGVLLFSDIYGHYLGCEVIPFGEPIKEASLLSSNNEVTGDEINIYVGMYCPSTKVNEEEGSNEYLRPSRCIDRFKVKTEDHDSVDDEDRGGDRSHGGEKGGGSSSSTSPKNNGSGSGGGDEHPEDRAAAYT